MVSPIRSEYVPERYLLEMLIFTTCLGFISVETTSEDAASVEPLLNAASALLRRLSLLLLRFRTSVSRGSSSAASRMTNSAGLGVDKSAGTAVAVTSCEP